MCPIDTQRLRFVCSATSRAPVEHLLEVALGQSLALGDHAEPVGAGGLGGPRVLEDLLGLHHRVHRRVGLGVARLGAEATVLGAATRLGVDQRAHVGRVLEALRPRAPCALDQSADLDVILELAELERFVAGDQRRHGRNARRRGGRVGGVGAPGRLGLRWGCLGSGGAAGGGVGRARGRARRRGGRGRRGARGAGAPGAARARLRAPVGPGRGLRHTRSPPAPQCDVDARRVGGLCVTLGPRRRASVTFPVPHVPPGHSRPPPPRPSGPLAYHGAGSCTTF